MTPEIFQMPALPLVMGALLIIFLPEAARRVAFLLFSLLSLILVLSLPSGGENTVALAGYELVPVTADALSRVFGIIFALTVFIGGIYAYHIKDRTQQAAALFYAGGALGVTYAGDFLTLFIFWEIMAVSSTYLVWAQRTDATDRAGLRYLVMHIFGGGLLFSGILLQVMETGSLAVEALPYAASPAGVLMLLGVGLNAAMIPLHAWLPDAYPKATLTGAVFMSAFTTKSAVYVLLRVFPGWEILIWVGVAMTLYGVLYAVLANGLRDILAYHIISQVGFMVAGVGIGTEMALNGAAAHAYSHILYKSLLFMSAGAVIYATGKTKLTELGGLARSLKGVLILYMIAAFSISGFPLFNGFISKSMTVDSAGYAGHEWAQLLLLLASVGTFLSVGIKLPYFTWFGPHAPKLELRAIPRNMMVAMSITGFLCFLYGVYPQLLYRELPFPVKYNPFTVYHFVEVTQILAFTFIGFWLLRKILQPKPKLVLDMDWFYRRPGSAVARGLVWAVDAAFAYCERSLETATRAVARAFVNPSRWLSPFASGKRSTTYSPPTGTVMLWVLLVFVVAGIFMLR